MIERIVHDGPDRILSVSRRRRFDGALRRAIEARDGRCTDDYCDEPADVCQVDHIQPWAQGGLTSQENGRLQCDFHNQRGTRPGGADPDRADPDRRTNERDE